MKRLFVTLLLSLFDDGLYPLLNLLILFTTLNGAILLFLGVHLPCPTVQRPTKIDQYNMGYFITICSNQQNEVEYLQVYLSVAPFW